MPNSDADIKRNTAKPDKRMARKKPFKQVFQFKITLQDIDSPIWRQIQAPENYTFYDLHVAIQDAMGWTDSHMHQFEVDNPATQEVEIIGYPDEGFYDDGTIAGWERRIADYFSMAIRRGKYIYDMGDYWVHLLELENILLRALGVKYPICLDGRRTCPPEDCGGPPGYDELVEALSSKDARKKREYLEWVGPHYNFEHFDPKEVRFADPKKRLKSMLEDE